MNLHIVYLLVIGGVAFIIAWLFYTREHVTRSRMRRALAVGGIATLGIVSWLSAINLITARALGGSIWRAVLSIQVMLAVGAGLAIILGVALDSGEAVSVSRESAAASARHRRLAIAYGLSVLSLLLVVVILGMSQRNFIAMSGKEFLQITRLAPFVYGVPFVAWVLFWECRAGRITRVFQTRCAILLPPIVALILIAALYAPMWFRFSDLLNHGLYKASVTVLLVGCFHVAAILLLWHLGCWLLLKNADQSAYERGSL